MFLEPKHIFTLTEMICLPDMNANLESIIIAMHIP